MPTTSQPLNMPNAAVSDEQIRPVMPQPETSRPPATAWFRIQEVVVGGLASLALIVCTYNIFVRQFMPGLTLEMSDEVQVYLMIWAVLLALGLVTATDRHIKADLFVGLFPPTFRRRVAVFGEALGLAFSLMLLATGAMIAWQAWSYGDLSATNLRFPLWIYIAALPTGAFLMSVSYARRFKNLL